MKLVFRWFVGALILVCCHAMALIETYDFSNQELEERYHYLSEELRCPKCQNQNIADSDAPIAQDLRKLLHQQLEEGASDGEILEYMTARYGEFVRYRPRFFGITMLLWLAPVLLLLAGIGVLLAVLRSRPKSIASEVSQLSSEEQARLQSLLDKVERDS
jgi:cytochrome c-type biogenesis protein CcmH